ncbi:alpha/beta-Hydrolase [Glarea lozoyensis ATCC 20868]|uniref:Alpha/beta-Hydrolase n=1 Tax=Glarea lozoyensis (strain ATCC 20868 / MF5171) TaxID=1116229 RepID=S3E7Y2_GLAL2|nr:alpha/beta-Hydrolase [Glarea lozoyensis ATCC 20868]EPE34453.1 alpha/beta-Hydrolase [Glarea lozoyensis ATCC 20868]
MQQYPHPFSQAAKLDSRITLPRPIYDPDLVQILDASNIPEEFDLDLMRGISKEEHQCAHGDAETMIFNAHTILKDKPYLLHKEHKIQGPDQNTIILSVFTPKESSQTPRPVLYHMHGGGLVSGDRFTALTPIIDLLEGIDCIVVSVEYRLSPETPQPGPSEDCYDGLVWISKNAISLGIDPARIVLFGISGGGIVATTVCLMARDRKLSSIPIKGLMLYAPQLDDRCETLSDQQFEYGNPTSTKWVRACWDLVLPNIRGTDEVTPYHAPARAEDYSHLPSTYIDAGECEVLRDQAVSFATNMWRCGSTCELHIWPGAYHIFEMINKPDNLLIQSAKAAKRNWLQRIMAARPKIQVAEPEIVGHDGQ